MKVKKTILANLERVFAISCDFQKEILKDTLQEEKNNFRMKDLRDKKGK